MLETIPGKNLMGLELPNPRRWSSYPRSSGSAVYNEGASLVTLGLGKDIAGKAVVVDLARMPHLMVAGTTGSGKSVGINAMILSISNKADPSQVRLILVDPKTPSSRSTGHPAPAVPGGYRHARGGNALQWCVVEMDKRYRLMSRLGVRSLAGYNAEDRRGPCRSGRIIR